MDICSKYTHISDVFIVAIMALVVKFYSFNDGLSVGTLLAMGSSSKNELGAQKMRDIFVFVFVWLCNRLVFDGDFMNGDFSIGKVRI